MTSIPNAAADKTSNDPDFSKANLTCDLVFKGGITSGVVYPEAIIELAKTYRFSSIGGTSAGAIAAAVAAAAEFARDTGGFVRLGAIPRELPPILFHLFQPAPPLKPLFDIAIAARDTKGSTLRRIATGIWIAIKAYWKRALLCALPGLALVAAGVAMLGAGWALLGAVMTLMGVGVALARALLRAVLKDIPANHFGICSGLSTAGYSQQALTEWLADTIDQVAGKAITAGSTPLTFGDLKGCGGGASPITLATMTTNLMMKRPYRLPMETNIFLFRPEEMEKLLPPRVFQHLKAFARELLDANGQPVYPNKEYLLLPTEENFPVVLAVRMSLSFPVLISAIPLYTRDFTLSEDKDRLEPRLCLFSDGGLSSNFPIHFFDRLWPNVPTFAITLDEFDEKRNKSKGIDRVWMPKSARSGIQLPVLPIAGGIGGFLMRLIDTAKDWQDNLQSVLPGYRERIVHVPLTPDEGGLNLGMDEGRIKALIEYGAAAGKLPVAQFNLHEHRWRRFLVAMDRLANTLEEMSEAYTKAPKNGTSFETFLNTCRQTPPGSYPQTQEDMDELLKRAEELVQLSKDWQVRAAQLPSHGEFNFPRPATDLRITPKP